jgi:hypothetical protein
MSPASLPKHSSNWVHPNHFNYVMSFRHKGMECNVLNTQNYLRNHWLRCTSIYVTSNHNIINATKMFVLFLHQDPNLWYSQDRIRSYLYNEAEIYLPFTLGTLYTCWWNAKCCFSKQTHTCKQTNKHNIYENVLPSNEMPKWKVALKC